MPEKLDEALDDIWCLKRRFCDFDVYVPMQRNKGKPGARKDHSHATLAVCKGKEVRFWDSKRLSTWHKESKKPKAGQTPGLPWLKSE